MNKTERIPIAEYARMLCGATESYEFPKVTFDFVTEKECRHPDMTRVEGYIRDLLTSGEAGDIKDGLSNILYWGWAQRSSLQCKRVQIFREQVREVHLVQFMEVAGGLRGPGLVSLKKIRLPQFSQMSFVSKVRMFLEPEKYPVLDLKIAGFANTECFSPLKNLKIYPTSIPITKHNETIYEDWASWCWEIAGLVNAEPTAPCNTLRAVDIERAIFQLASDGQSQEAWRLLARPQI